MTGSVESFDIRALLRPEAFPHPVRDIQLVQTHMSWVVLTGAFAYKIKKAVRFDFIDCSAPERRRELCEEELRLNQRLAPELYLDVVPIGLSGNILRVGACAHALEHAVRMRQFDRSQELQSLLAADAIMREEIDDLAARLAGFHERAAVARGGMYGNPGRLPGLFLGNLAALRQTNEGAVHAGALDRIEVWLQSALAELQLLFARRRAQGRVRECHGDLHTRNIVRWEGRLLPFDCLEFDPELRWIDVASEIAFLHMDLQSHGRGDLAAAFLCRYLEVCGDYELLRVLRLYAVHRALVRAKIDALQLAQRPAPELAAELSARLAARLKLATRLIEPRRPALILMHGTSGSGKSWLSDQLVADLEAIRVRSDLERKRLAGLDPLARSGAALHEGTYATEVTARTYARLADCAQHALRGGFTVIVDAAFLEEAQRAAFMALARRHAKPLFIVSCEAAPAILRARVQARMARGQDASEATLEVLEHQLAHAQPLSPTEKLHTLRVDTAADAAPRTVAAAIRQRLAASPP